MADEYISRKDVLDNSNIITVQTKEYGSIEVIPVDTIADIELADVQSVYCAENVQNEVLNYLFNKEREAESMSYGDKRQERIVTIREIIRFVEDIDPRAVEAWNKRFTGIVDKNGKKIYDGDLVKITIDHIGYISIVKIEILKLR